MEDKGAIPFTVVVLLIVLLATKIGFVNACIICTVMSYAVIAMWFMFFVLGILFVGIKASWHFMKPARIIKVIQEHI